MGLNATDHTRINILIVDDNEYERERIGAIFRKHDFMKIQMAENGLEALQDIEDWQPDLIVLDTIMPGISSEAFCKHVMENIAARPPIIISQTMPNARQLKHMLRMFGVTDFVSKPVDETELIARTILHLKQLSLEEVLSEYENQVSAFHTRIIHLLNIMENSGGRGIYTKIKDIRCALNAFMGEKKMHYKSGT